MTTGQGLAGEIVLASSLDAATRLEMWNLMARYFREANRSAFERDLAGKRWAILLRDDGGAVQGFSTLDLMEADLGGRPVRAIYSGDTIAERSHWGTAALPRAFLRFVARHTGADSDEAEWYWFYVCKGYRTYRFLPVFYHHFFPCPARATPRREQAVMDALATRRFGDAYNRSTGVVRVPGDYALRPGVGDVTAERRRDPFVEFFQCRNPGWPQGDELVCLARIGRENLRARPRRWLAEERSS